MSALLQFRKDVEMLFNSYQFIFLFLPITAILFYAIAHIAHPRYAACWLILASLFFYGYWNPEYIPLLLFSILFNYAIGMAIIETGKRTEQKALMRFLLFLGVSVNLLVIGYYKYAIFFVQNINHALRIDVDIGQIILPIGISFYTFTQISFLVDAYKKRAKAYPFIHYSLFVTFFPHLIAGPILHHKEMMPQFSKPDTYRLHYENLAVGLTIFFMGLFKKVVFADLIAAGYVNPVFDRVLIGHPLGHPFGLVACWGGALAYTLQLYFDFSGYSDMAIGLARILGIKLPINFDSPYKAVNIVDFWRRWHMTLSRFFRDYIYIPLGGNRRTPGLTYLNLMVTMVLCGLWHGAGWTFIVWGGLHGLYLTINQLWRRLFESSRLSKLQEKRQFRIVSHLITFLCVVVGWTIFRSADMKSAMMILKGMAGLNGLSLSQPDWQMWLSISFLLFIVWFCPNTQQIMGRFDPGFNVYKRDDQLIPMWHWIQWRPDWIWAIVLVFISGVGIATVVISNVREFLYFQF